MAVRTDIRGGGGVGGGGGNYFYIDAPSEVPTAPLKGYIVKVTTAIPSGLLNFFDTNGTTPVTSADLDDGFEWDGTKWVKKEVPPAVNDAGDYFFIDTASEVPSGPAVGVIVKVTTAIASGLVNFVDTDGSTAVTSAAVGDAFEWNGSKWVKKESAASGGGGGGGGLTIGPSFPTNPSAGNIHKLNVNANLQVVSYTKNLTGKDTFSNFGSGTGRVIWGSWQGVANNSYFLGLTSSEAAHFTSLKSGDTIYIGSEEITLTGAPTYNSGLSLLIITNYSNTVSSNPFSNNVTYAAQAYPASTGFEKGDEFRYNGNTWSQVFDEDESTHFLIRNTLPSTPAQGTLVKLSEDATLSAIAGEYPIVGETNSTQYVNSAADPNDIRTFYNPSLSPPSLFARYKSGEDISGFLGAQSGDDLLFIPQSGTTIVFDLGQAPTNSANARQLNFTNMVSPPNTSPLTDGASYLIAILYQSRTFNKGDILVYRAPYWVRIYAEDSSSAFDVSSVSTGTFARDDKVVAEDVSAADNPNIANTIANLFALIEASDIRYEFVAEKTSAYTIVATDERKIVPVNTSSGNVTITLPDLNSNDDGFKVTVLKVAAANTVTVDGNGSDTINDAANVTMTENHHAITFGWDGTEWFILVEANNPEAGGGNTYTVGTTLPSNPETDDIHKLSANNSTLDLYVASDDRSAVTAQSSFTGGGSVIYYGAVNGQTGFYFKNPGALSNLTHLKAGDTITLVPTSGTTLTLTLTGDSPVTFRTTFGFSNVFIAANKFTQSYNTNSLTSGVTYTVRGKRASYNKGDEFKYSGSAWIEVYEAPAAGGGASFAVSDVSDGTLTRSDKVVAEDVSASGTPNIASTIANLFGLIQASDVRTEFEGVKTAAYTVVTADEGKVIPMNTASGNLTVNLPDLASGDDGFSVIILKTSASNTLTVDPNGSDQINGGATLSVTGGDHAIVIMWDGTAWWMVAEANRPTSASNITLSNMPRMKADYLYAGAGTGTAVVAKPVFDTTETQQSNGTLAYDSGTIAGSDSAGPNDPADYGDVSDGGITSEVFAGGRLYRLEAGYDFLALRIRFDGTVTQGVAFEVRYSTVKPTTTNLSSHGTQLQQVGTVSNVFEQDGTISNPENETYFWGVPTATRTITNRKLRLDGSYTKTENVDVDGVIELGDGLEIDSAGKLDTTQYPEFDTVKTADYTVLAADNGRVIPVNTTSGDLTVNLPDLGATDDGFEVTILKTASANEITVDAHGTDTINGATTLIVQRHYEAVRLGWDGAAWWVLGEANESRSSQANASYGFSEVLWATSGAFVNGDLDDTGTLDFTIASNAATGVTDGANTKVTVPKLAPDNVSDIRVQLFNASHAKIDEVDIPWGNTSSVLARRLEVDNDTYASFIFDFINGTPTLTFSAENSDNGLTGHYIKVNAILLAPNQHYTPQIPLTKNGVHRRCVAELSGTTGSTAPGLSLITAAYTPQNANARIYVRLRIVAYCVGNSDNDYSQIAVRVKRGSNNYKRIDEGADGFTAIAGQRMWQYSDNTARAHYEEFELEPENSTDEIKVNLSVYMKDGATVTSATGWLNRWGSNRNLGPSFIEVYELMENGTLTRTTITSLDSA